MRLFCVLRKRKENASVTCLSVWVLKCSTHRALDSFWGFLSHFGIIEPLLDLLTLLLEDLSYFWSFHATFGAFKLLQRRPPVKNALSSFSYVQRICTLLNSIQIRVYGTETSQKRFRPLWFLFSFAIPVYKPIQKV